MVATRHDFKYDSSAGQLQTSSFRFLAKQDAEGQQHQDDSNPHASAIDFLTSSIPNGGFSSAEVIMAGRHVGAAANILRCMMGMTSGALSRGKSSVFVMMAWSVNLRPDDARDCSPRVRSMMVSVSVTPCLALMRT
jgi:hypothetical protein